MYATLSPQKGVVEVLRASEKLGTDRALGDRGRRESEETGGILRGGCYRAISIAEISCTDSGRVLRCWVATFPPEAATELELQSEVKGGEQAG